MLSIHLKFYRRYEKTVEWQQCSEPAISFVYISHFFGLASHSLFYFFKKRNITVEKEQWKLTKQNKTEQSINKLLQNRVACCATNYVK